MSRGNIEEFIIKLKDQFSGKLREADEALDDTREKTNELESSLNDLKKAALGYVAAIGAQEVFNATRELAKMQDTVRALTGQQGQAADQLISHAQAISSTYDEEASRVLQAANALTKQMGGSLESNLALIQQGFERGANSNGEFLDSLREYPALMRDAGLSASQMVAMISQSATQGIYSDKAIDSIKEGNLSLREMTKIQRDALASIGVDAQALLEEMNTGAISPFQAMQKIVGAMDDFDIAAKQTIVADIFKGAGEDTGNNFVAGLASIDLELNNIEKSSGDFTTALFEINMMFAEIKNQLLNAIMPALAGLMTWVTQNTPFLKGLATALGVVAGAMAILKIATIAQTIATMNLTAAMMANPIGLIVGAIAALVGAVVWAYNEFETFRNFVDSAWQVLKNLGSFMLSGLKAAFITIGKFIMKYHPVAILMRGVKALFPKFFESMMKQMKRFTSWLSDVWGSIKAFFGFGDDAKIEVKDGTSKDNQSSPEPQGTGSLLGGFTGGGKMSQATQAAAGMSSGLSEVKNTAPKVFNINIDKLIEQFRIETSTMSESPARIKELVMKALLEGVNDVQANFD